MYSLSNKDGKNVFYACVLVAARKGGNFLPPYHYHFITWSSDTATYPSEDATHIKKSVCVCIGKEEHMRFLCLSYNVNIQTKIRTTQYAKYETIFIHEISKVSRRSRAESGLIVYCDVNSLSGVFECLIVMF